MQRVVGKNGEKMDYSDEISEKQKIIRTLLGQIGWSVSMFAGTYCYDTNNYNIDDKDYKNCKEKIKKQITSSCKTKKILGELYKFIEYIQSTDEFEKTNQFKLKPISENVLDPELTKILKSTSKSIDKKILTNPNSMLKNSFRRQSQKLTSPSSWP